VTITAETVSLPGMPEPYELWSRCGEEETLVGYGPRVLFRFDPADRGMRNLAIVALTDAGVAGKQVASLFGLSAEHVSRLRSRVASHGSAALVPPMGAPPKLTARQQAKAVRLAGEGRTGAEIAARLSVSEATISRLLARRRQQATAQELSGGADGEQRAAAKPGAPGATTSGRAGEQDGGDEAAASSGESRSDDEPEPAPLAPLTDLEVGSRYAGAMLLWPFLTRLGADDVLSVLAAEPARRYDAPTLVAAATFAFALGTSSMEASKHLAGEDAGALVGARSFPHLRTLRPRLSALAEQADPLAVQRAFAKAMLAADERPPEVFYVDDHFVTYWGAAPVAKGYNIRRHLAEPGRDDTFVVDDAWRAICFCSGEPRGLSVSLPEVLVQLREVVGERRVTVGFDRGGSYPKVFAQIAAAGMDWVTWRRAPLVAPRSAPRRSWVEVDGRRRVSLLSDEVVSLDGYDAGPVRQLSAFEGDKVVFQVLTSSTEQRTAAATVHRLRCRWRIENTNKYLEEHQGVHWLCSYGMDVEADTTPVANPARKAGTAKERSAKQALADAERELGRQAKAPLKDIDEHVAAMSARHDALVMAEDDLAEARAELKGVRAKLPANELDPAATRARPRLAARALQMVCRLLAYNAELDLARRLDTYLCDPDEYRAIARNLLHLGGRIAFERRQIVVTLDRPRAPRVARALGLLLDELGGGPPAHLLGDRRPILYRLDGQSD
jgi:transposase